MSSPDPQSVRIDGPNYEARAKDFADETARAGCGVIMRPWPDAECVIVDFWNLPTKELNDE